jgi:hypothetical protein
MTTLHIEHPISDYPTWRAAFDAFEPARTAAGVTAHRIQRPVDDPNYLVIDLEFESADRAGAFRQFLETNVWSSPNASPALAGKPRTLILDDV